MVLMLKDPVYEHDSGNVNAQEIVQEQIEFIWDTLLNVNIAENGYPPTNYQEARAFFANHLRTVLSLAAGTQLRLESFGSLSTAPSFDDIMREAMQVNPLAPEGLPDPNVFHEQGFGVAHDIQGTMTASGYVYPEMGHSTDNYLQDIRTLYNPADEADNGTRYGPI
jgi:hypothetical protein